MINHTHIRLAPAKYVAAVSGGLDSMVMLDILRKQPGLTLHVAHVDHGIRPESAHDRKFVQEYCARSKLDFSYKEASLGPGSSELKARVYRQQFLIETMQEVGAAKIITAHHRDDVLETIVINLIRGTGRRGLSSLKDTAVFARPMLRFYKADLLDYAIYHNLQWVEDSTNESMAYLRNRIRNKLVVANLADQQKMLQIRDSTMQLNYKIDSMLSEIVSWVEIEPGVIDRDRFRILPYVISLEVALVLLGQHLSVDRPMVELVTNSIKTIMPNTVLHLANGHELEFSPKLARFKHNI